MDGQAYLNQISASTRRPEPKSPVGKIVGSLYFKIGAIAVGAFILIAIIGAIINAAKPNLEEQSISLKLRLDHTMSVISDFQPSVKSSTLRSSSASLYSVLSNASTSLTTFLTDNYNFRQNSIPADLTEEADLNAESLTNSLFTAKINGTLDRMYAHQMAYEISWIMSKEATIINGSKDSTLNSALTTSYNSLVNLYPQFDEFSEAK